MPKVGLFTEWVHIILWPRTPSLHTLTPSLRTYTITANGSKYRWSMGSSGKDLPKVGRNAFDNPINQLANQRYVPLARDGQPQEESSCGTA